MFGSDWPVCLLAADYGAVSGWSGPRSPISPRPNGTTILGGTAARIYGLT